MSSFYENKISNITVICIVLVCVLLTIQRRWIGWFGDEWKLIISGDGSGYYAYLPAVFLEGNFLYSEAIKREKLVFHHDPPLFINNHNGKPINKYFAGTAILLTPFFLLACLAALLSDYPLDGYSFPFQISVSIGALFYFTIGILYVKRFYKLWGFNDNITSLLLIFLVFATQLCHYVTMEPSMSHTYSFAMISVLLYAGSNLFKNIDSKRLALVSGILGMITLIRPSNILIAFVLPFLAGNYQMFRNAIIFYFKRGKFLLGPVFIFTIIISTQFVMYYLQSDEFILWSYKGERFNFLNPEISNVLFSYRKGLFIWTPITFFALPGLVVITANNRFQGLFLLFLLLILIYFISAWECWWYGWSFGLRAFVEFFPLFLFLLGVWLKWSMTHKPVLFFNIIICLACLVIMYIQTDQYRLNILLPDSMTKSAYWKVFLRRDQQYYGYLEKLKQPPLPELTINEQCSVVYYDFDKETQMIHPGITDAYSYSGNYSVKINKDNPYSPGLTMDGDTMVTHTVNNIQVTAKVFIEDIGTSAIIAFSYEDSSGKVYRWQNISLSSLINKAQSWEPIRVTQILLPAEHANDVIKIFFMNEEEEVVFIDDLKIAVCEKQ